MPFLTCEEEVWRLTLLGPTFTECWILSQQFQQMCKQKDALLCFWQFLKPKWRIGESINWRPSGSKLLPLQQSKWLEISAWPWLSRGRLSFSALPRVDATLLCLSFFTCKTLPPCAGVSFSLITRSSRLDVSWVGDTMPVERLCPARAWLWQHSYPGD